MIYRATAKFKADVFLTASTPRAPGNVPFYVDNIWEWLRPEGYPSRRFSAFASPTIELAASSAGCRLDEAYQLELTDHQPICQIVDGERPEDAKFHSDIGRLKRQIIRAIPPEWFARPLVERGPEAVLFLPCATRVEIETAMCETLMLVPDNIRSASTFWSDVRLLDATDISLPLHPQGEIFFEGRYRLLR